MKHGKSTTYGSVLKKVKTGLQAQTQLFVYGLFIYNQWRGMGTLNSVDVISQHYKLQMDLYVSSYASGS